MHRKKKRINNKKNQRIKKFLLGITLLISCCIVLTLIATLKPEKEEYYTIKDRTKQIEKSKKKDTEDYKTIGWIRVQGTNIDTPVIGYSNNVAGVPVELGNYVWNLDPEEKYYNKINIMGHNIMNLSSQPEVGLDYFTRFDDLMSFVYYDFAKENQYIQYTVDGKNYLYKIFSVYFEPSHHIDSYPSGNYSEKKMAEYIKRYKEMSLYKYDIEVNKEDDIISLMTCTRFYGVEKYVTFMVNARKVRENEVINNYEVEQTKEYKEVKKILKGDELDEKA